MRDIKFRCWDTVNKEMLDIQELNYEDSYNGQPMIRTTMYNDYFDTEDMILMQYTGLKDKNGKEIYEGDIVKIKDELCIVEYNYNSFGLKVIDKTKPYNWVEFIVCKCEVIGNIYENKNLLEEK